jgi:organic hydroperoxide reductase OsmC/OhrA
MSHKYRATVVWQRSEGEEDFVKQRYSRRHLWRFDGGAEVAGSSAPTSVPLPWSDAAAVDPEEAFVASLSSCHMLWFLSLAAKAHFTVARYEDEAVGVMTPNAQGKLWVSAVTLRPAVAFDGERCPTPTETDALHHRAHEECFIANSVKTEVRIEARDNSV